MHARALAAAAGLLTLVAATPAQSDNDLPVRIGPRDWVVRPSVRSFSMEGLGTHSAGPRPKQWCGWYMRTRHGGGPEFNTAWHWRHYGRPGAPRIGAIVIWPHHVGEIVDQTADGRWIVLSGNWSSGVRRHVISLKGALVRVT